MPSLLSVNVGPPKKVVWQGRTVYPGVWEHRVDGPRMVRTEIFGAAPALNTGIAPATARPRGGVEIKRVEEWLGHHSAAFTLDIYGHLMPDDREATSREVFFRRRRR